MVNPKKQWEREDNLNRLLSLLKQHGELTFSDLKEKMGVSEPTLTKYIKTLEKQEKIKPFFKPEDRRQRWYRIKLENKKEVEAQLGKYEAIKFIGRISNPVYIDEPSKDGSRAMALFSSVPPEENREAWEKELRKKTMFGMLLKVFPRLKKECDIALVIMVRGKRKGVKP